MAGVASIHIAFHKLQICSRLPKGPGFFLPQGAVPGRYQPYSKRKMSTTSLATSYYLKAFDAYPYEIGEVEENLDYALAYDSDHIPSLCLKSKLYLYHLGWTREARELAERAMSVNPRDVCAATSLLNCMVAERSVNEALQFLSYIERKVPMAKWLKIYYLAKVMDLKGEFKIALNYYKMMILYSENPNHASQIEAQVTLLKQKLKQASKLKKQRLLNTI